MTYRPPNNESLCPQAGMEDNIRPYPPPVETAASPTCGSIYETFMDAFQGCFEGYEHLHGSTNTGERNYSVLDSSNEDVPNIQDTSAHSHSDQAPPALQNSEYWPPALYHSGNGTTAAAEQREYSFRSYHRRSWSDYEYSTGYNCRAPRTGDNRKDERNAPETFRSYSYDHYSGSNYPTEYDYYYNSSPPTEDRKYYSSAGRQPRQPGALPNRMEESASYHPTMPPPENRAQVCTPAQPIYGQESNAYTMTGDTMTSSKPKRKPKVVVAGQLVDSLRDLDVVCGRGAPSQYHYGNQAFKELVGQYQTSYLCAKRSDKPDIAMKLLDMVKERGGRFVRRKKAAGHFCWETIGDKASYERVCQALREGAPELRQKMLSASSIHKQKSGLSSQSTSSFNKEEYSSK